MNAQSSTDRAIKALPKRSPRETYAMHILWQDMEYARSELVRVAHNPHCYAAVLAAQAFDEAQMEYEAARASLPSLP